jgi:mannosyl-glycoprotein endo-beta-N-acetylglucosaminidase
VCRVLTAALHASSPHALVVWYDAVTIEGKLEWQNTLNDLNRPFFDACDAIWINYSWKEGGPEEVRKQVGHGKGVGSGLG